MAFGVESNFLAIRKSLLKKLDWSYWNVFFSVICTIRLVSLTLQLAKLISVLENVKNGVKGWFYSQIVIAYHLKMKHCILYFFLTRKQWVSLGEKKQSFSSVSKVTYWHK